MAICQMLDRIKTALSAFVIVAMALVGLGMLPFGEVARAQDRPKPLQVVVLGDSLSAGYQLPQDSAFPTLLERALRADGVDVDVTNAGVSGDTARGGLERLDWAVPDGTDAVIVELGANDMLRGSDPEQTKDSLDKIIVRLKERGIKVLLAGMKASPSLGREYGEKFNAIYPDLARRHGVPLYPFFLEGVAGNRALNIEDGMHPNRRGVEMIVRSIFPTVREFLTGVAG